MLLKVMSDLFDAMYKTSVARKTLNPQWPDELHVELNCNNPSRLRHERVVLQVHARPGSQHE